MLVTEEELRRVRDGRSVIYRARGPHNDGQLRKFLDKPVTLDGADVVDVVHLVLELEGNHGKFHRREESRRLRSISDSSPEPETGELRWVLVLGEIVEVA